MNQLVRIGNDHLFITLDPSLIVVVTRDALTADLYERNPELRTLGDNRSVVFFHCDNLDTVSVTPLSESEALKDIVRQFVDEYLSR